MPNAAASTIPPITFRSTIFTQVPGSILRLLDPQDFPPALSVFSVASCSTLPAVRPRSAKFKFQGLGAVSPTHRARSLRPQPRPPALPAP